MTRVIVGDTETTGLHSSTERITEIGLMELIDLKPTGRYYHVYLFSGRKIPKIVTNLTGITNKFLVGKPTFMDIKDSLIDFIGDSDIVAHNAPFDRDFINKELEICNEQIIPEDRWIDTLTMAREMFPGKRASLDALCSKYKVDVSARDFHGAIVDAMLLSEVYIHMTKKEDTGFLNLLEDEMTENKPEQVKFISQKKHRSIKLSTEDEIRRHSEFMASIDKENGRRSVWRDYIEY